MTSCISQKAKQFKNMFKKQAIDPSQLPDLGKREYIKLVFLSILDHFRGHKFAPLPQTAGSCTEYFRETVFSGDSYYEYDCGSSDVFTFGKLATSIYGSDVIKKEGKVFGKSSETATAVLNRDQAEANTLKGAPRARTEFDKTHPSELLLSIFDMSRGSARDAELLNELAYSDEYSRISDGVSFSSFAQYGCLKDYFQSTNSGHTASENLLSPPDRPWTNNKNQNREIRVGSTFCYEPGLSSILEMEEPICYSTTRVFGETIEEPALYQGMPQVVIPVLDTQFPAISCPPTPVQSPLSVDEITEFGSADLMETGISESFSAQVMNPKAFRLRLSRGGCTLDNAKVWHESDSDDDDFFNADENTYNSDTDSVIIDNTKHRQLFFPKMWTIFHDLHKPLITL